MKTQQRVQETLANNLANAQTPGFKSDQATVRAFPELLINHASNNRISTTRPFAVRSQQPIGSLNTGVYVQETIPDHEQGGLQETGMATDMALVNVALPDETGGLFFTVQNEEGEVRYTRNGNFTVDGEGFLTTNQGFHVLNQAGEPVFTDGQIFTVTNDGVLEIDGADIPLNIAYTENVNDLIKDGEDLFTFTEDAGEAVDARATAGISFSVQQRFLENSNVDMVQTMTDMMRAFRLFETNQTVLQAYDQSMDLAVNQIARLT